MNILQISAPKSGSFWLNTILQETLKKKDIDISSFIKNQPDYQSLKIRKLSFKDQAAVDMVDIQDDGFFYRVSSLLRERIQDPSTYSRSATLAWTHSTWCNNSADFFKHYDKKVCIVRDPRDRALSSAKFAFTPYMQEHYPTDYASVGEFLESEFDRLIEQWVWFYGNYLLHKNKLDLHFVFYENLLRDFDREFERLLEYLELDIEDGKKQDIARAVSFSSMKEESPRHLQKGKSRKWVEKLNRHQKERTIELAGDLMKVLNYPLKEEEGLRAPATPHPIPENELYKILKKIDWNGLF